MSVEVNNEDMFVPEEICVEAAEALAQLLPQKSKHRYEKEYSTFSSWRSQKNVKGMSEDIILAYISERSKTVSPNSLWSYFSMLKATILVKENKDIGR